MSSAKLKSIRETSPRRKIEAQTLSQRTSVGRPLPTAPLAAFPTRSEFIAALPHVRSVARQWTRHGQIADRLVEQTIKRAIDELPSFPRENRLDEWLIHLMSSTGIGRDAELLH